MANPVGTKYTSNPLAVYLKKALWRKYYGTFSQFAKDNGLTDALLQKYIRGDARFDLHYFWMLVETLDLNANELYLLVYQQDKKRGRI
jgi:hypothetical protein